MRPLSRIEKQWLEECILNYKNYDREINLRKLELLEKRENLTPEIQRQAGITNHNEQDMVKLLDDPYIQQQERFKKAVTETAEALPSEPAHLMHLRFKERPYEDTWEVFTEDLYCSKHKIYKMRDEILQCYAKHINYLR
ncbi:hypothetical protein [Aerococcus sp. UMB7834]|uniref:hypothetical protein n=1 Tax=Aerococcus sp. UMB7834 TaxID=3046342 RepID=UPI00254D7415|nr:hypothetical protein [Aerococcus sp. UMB7834]MDK6804247.1 hypothetical protein [Aerococcus sp. UMB7834]